MDTTPLDNPKIAVLIPCYQEEKTIAKVVRDFLNVLPTAEIYVYDNNSTDKTAELAQASGAIVVREKRQGKGFVVISMFEQIDADAYIMVDGDDTYDPSYATKLLEPILKDEADMTVGCRLSRYDNKSFRNFHIFGNQFICFIINKMFGSNITDIFSGYRAFGRNAVKTIPLTCAGFDVETEMTLQALQRGFVIKEFSTPYGVRPEGSFSKLSTLKDGTKVLVKLFKMLQSYKPLTFFGIFGLLFFVSSLLVGSVPIYEYIVDQNVLSVPKSILAASLMVISVLSGCLGVILNSINLRTMEMEQLIIKRTRKNPLEK